MSLPQRIALRSNDKAIADQLIAIAASLIDSLPTSEVHSVAAAAITRTGQVYTGVNVFHFTGGPCAELVLLGNAAAANAVSDLTHIAAVGNEGRVPLNPCGRCRQVLLDLCPDVKAVCVNGEGEVEVVDLCSLLKYSYRAGK